MNKKIKIFSIIIIVVIALTLSLTNFGNFGSLQIVDPHNFNFSKIFDGPTIVLFKNNTLYFTLSPEDIGIKNVTMPANKILFNILYHYDGLQITSVEITPNHNYTKLYQEIGLFNSSKKIAFVYPIFTQAAYDPNGFYDYYNKKCDSKCLTINIPFTEKGVYPASGRAAAVLSILNYSYITDVDIDIDPDIIKKYDRIIMLHSEYVTKREFNAITSHPDVIYLYPNALYAEVKSDYLHNTITLVKGHGYPDPNIKNGFDWKYDNTKFEYDQQCDNWSFYKINNGKMLNCYPSFRVYYDMDLLKMLKN